MITVNVSTKETRRAAASIVRDLILGAPVVLSNVVDEVAEHAKAHPEFYTPRHGLGGLQGATKARFISASGARLVARVYNDRPYAAAVHFGARPHPIVARRAKFLRFFWPKVGHVVFFRRVNHPGNKSMPFLETPRRFGEQRLAIALWDLVANVTRRYSH
jgi:hypothetical protein